VLVAGLRVPLGDGDASQQQTRRVLPR